MDITPLSNYMDTSVFTGQGKVTLLEYTWLSCGPCLLIMNTFSRLLDSLGDKIQIIAIDPLGEADKADFVSKLLECYNIKGRVNYLLLGHGHQEITYNHYIKNYPLLLVIDKDGIVRALKAGLNQDEDAFEAIYNLVKAVVE